MTLKKFDPFQMSDDAVRRVATGRTAILADIMATIEQNRASGPGTLQHLAIVAPRGTGKTFLFRLLGLEIDKRQQEGADLVFLHLPEELPFLDAPPVLIREILIRLAGGRATDHKLQWQSAEADWDALCRQLDAALAERFGAGRGLLVLGLENIEEVLADGFADASDQCRLRAWLDRPDGRIMLIAASSRGKFDAKSNRPLFGIVRTHHLKDWRDAQTEEYFAKTVPMLTGKDSEPRQLVKAKAVAAFTGGSPRMAAALVTIITQNEPLTAAQTLAALLDDLTDYYRDRLKNLGARARKCLDTLLRFGEPQSQSAVAERLGVKQSTVAQAFKELRDKALLSEERLPGSKEIHYRVADRVFAHYYRVRHLQHGTVASPLEHLVELLVNVYTPEERAAEADRLYGLGQSADARAMLRTLTRQDGTARDMDWWDSLRTFINDTLRYAARWQVPDGPWHAALVELREFRSGAAAVAERLLACRASDGGCDALPRIAAGLAFLCDGKSIPALGQFTRARDATTDPRLVTQALLGEGLVHVYQPNWPAGHAAATVALAQAEAAKEPVLVARAWRAIGYFSWRSGDDEASLSAYGTANELAIADGDAIETAWGWQSLAVLKYQSGQVGPAIACLEQAHNHATNSTDDVAKSHVMRDIARLSNAFGNPELTRRSGEAAIACARRANDAYALVRSLTSYASNLPGADAQDQTIPALREAVEVAARSGSALLIRHAKALLAFVLSQPIPLPEVQVAEVLALADAVLTPTPAPTDSVSPLRAWHSKMIVFAKLDRYADCLEAARPLAVLARRADQPWYLAAAQLVIVLALARLGRLDEAVTAGRVALLELARFQTPESDLEQKIYSLILIALTRSGRTAEKSPLIAEARDRFHALGAEAELATILGVAIELALGQDDADAVATHLEEWGRLQARGAVKDLKEAHWLVRALIVVTLAGAWPRVGPALGADAWSAAADDGAGDELAKALTEHAAAHGRAAAFAALVGLLEALAPHLPPEPGSAAGTILTQLINGLIRTLGESGLLADSAAAIAERWPGRFEDRVRLLECAAQFHAGGRTREVLARLDPDVATALRIMWLRDTDG